MSVQLLKLRGVDPLLFRDGRPFSSEKGALSARTMTVPAPGTVAGFLRTLYGDQHEWDWNDPGKQQEAGSILVAGPLLICNEEPIFAAPADAVVYRPDAGKEDALMPLRPCENAAGCDLPEGLLPLNVTHDVKPASGYNLWRWSDLRRWLADAEGRPDSLPAKLEGPVIEERVHVAIDSQTGRSDEGKLFTAQFVGFDRLFVDESTCRLQEWSLLARMETSDGELLAGGGTLGGERRLAVVESAPSEWWVSCPEEPARKIASSKRVRMILATPAIFSGGWKPGWLDASLQGSPPGMEYVRLRLISAAVKRREPVSGWDYASKTPKEVRWMSPAGSVYFFEVVEGSAEPLSNAGWLQPVSDREQDRRDGYGLALWGVW